MLCRDVRWPTAAVLGGVVVACAAAASAQALDDSTEKIAPDPCFSTEIAASPTRPTWSMSTATTQCGVIEDDLGFVWQPMGPGNRQAQLVSSIRYGVTPKLDLRLGLTNLIAQYGASVPSVRGAGDDWISVRFRMTEASQTSVSLAFSYGYKFATASPGKGLGSGFADHALVLVASRDVGRTHFDWNGVWTITGESYGHEAPLQCDLSIARQFAKRWSGVVESYGGGQPGVRDRFGAVLAGASYTLNPRFVLDVAYMRAYTAGSPRSQIAFGMTYARNSIHPLLQRSYKATRWMGR